MNSLVVYDSQFGNTEKIAHLIAETLRDFGEARAEHVTQVKPDALEGVDLLVVGCPTQGWQSTVAMKTFFAGLERQSVERWFAAAFDTRLDKPRWLTGSAARGMADQLRRLGATTLLPPESFLVKGTEGPLADGELEHAARWARLLHDHFQAQLQSRGVMA